MWFIKDEKVFLDWENPIHSIPNEDHNVRVRCEQELQFQPPELVCGS